MQSMQSIKIVQTYAKILKIDKKSTEVCKPIQNYSKVLTKYTEVGKIWKKLLIYSSDLWPKKKEKKY